MASLTIGRVANTTTGLQTHGGFKTSHMVYTVSPARGTGFVIQHVTRAFDVYRLNNGQPGRHAMTAGEMEDFINPNRRTTRYVYADVLEYWEAWPIPFDGRYQVTDTFNFYGFITSTSGRVSYASEGTKGTFEQNGTATFYTDASPERTLANTNMGFARGRATLANNLLYTESRPQNLPSTSSNSKSRSIKVKWDDSQFSRIGTVAAYNTELVHETP